MKTTNKLNIDTVLENWFQQLEQEQILAKVVRNQRLYYHFNSPIKFIYPKTQINNLRSKYHPKEEKGGYILFQHSNNDSNLILKAVDIKWVDNISSSPEKSYTINTPEHKRIEKEAYLNQLFPIRFHTHPMDVKDFNKQSYRRLQIIDTSDKDRKISFNYPFKTQNTIILLPDVLVVWDINYLNSFFIGTYNGLIAPIGFQRHRIKVTKEFNNNIGNSISKWIDEKSDLVKGVLAIGTLVTVVAGMRYPQVSGPILKEIKNQNPMLAIGTQKENEYFGFANTNPLFEFAISIPRVTKELIDDNEEEIKAVLQRLN